MLLVVQRVLPSVLFVMDGRNFSRNLQLMGKPTRKGGTDSLPASPTSPLGQTASWSDASNGSSSERGGDTGAPTHPSSSPLLEKQASP
jgi:hypothetical protein